MHSDSGITHPVFCRQCLQLHFSSRRSRSRSSITQSVSQEGAEYSILAEGRIWVEARGGGLHPLKACTRRTLRLQKGRWSCYKHCARCLVGLEISRVGQNRICTPYLTVYLVIYLPKIHYIHRVNMVLAKSKCVPCWQASNFVLQKVRAHCVLPVQLSHQTCTLCAARAATAPTCQCSQVSDPKAV